MSTHCKLIVPILVDCGVHGYIVTRWHYGSPAKIALEVLKHVTGDDVIAAGEIRDIKVDGHIEPFPNGGRGNETLYDISDVAYGVDYLYVWHKGSWRECVIRNGDIMLLSAAVFEPTGFDALEIMDGGEDYFEFQMDMAADMSVKDVAELIIDEMTLTDMVEDLAEIMEMQEED